MTQSSQPEAQEAPASGSDEWFHEDSLTLVGWKYHSKGDGEGTYRLITPYDTYASSAVTEGSMVPVYTRAALGKQTTQEAPWVCEVVSNGALGIPVLAFNEPIRKLTRGTKLYAAAQEAPADAKDVASDGKDLKLSPTQLEIIRHSLGLRRDGTGRVYRNFFATGERSTDFSDCCALVGMGFMTRRPGSAITNWEDCFHVTEAGKVAALQSHQEGK